MLEGAPRILPRLLERAGPLQATHPEDGGRIERGRLYVAPPNVRLLLEEGRVRVVRGPKENRHRPTVEPLFRTAALACGPRVVGVVLTGALGDGTAGLRAERFERRAREARRQARVIRREVFTGASADVV